MTTIFTAADVITLSREQLSDAAAVLADAFVDDSLMRHLFRVQPPKYHSHLRELFRFSCEVRLDLEWPLLGSVSGDRLVGVAAVTRPDDTQWPASLSATYERLKSSIGPEATERLERYSRVADRYLPGQPHYYLGAIGVRPEAQGKGHARALLDRVRALSEAHATSIGVGLDTENPTNVKIYERFGYHVVAETSIDGLDVWCMFRPNGA